MRSIKAVCFAFFATLAVCAILDWFAATIETAEQETAQQVRERTNKYPRTYPYQPYMDLTGVTF